jgi:hypothetical protein
MSIPGVQITNYQYQYSNQLPVEFFLRSFVSEEPLLPM